MATAAQTDIVGVALEWAVVAQLDITEHLPTHIVVGTELERAVFHQLGIDATIGRIVDILEEKTPHRGLDLGPHTLGIDRDYPLRLLRLLRSRHKHRAHQHHKKQKSL